MKKLFILLAFMACSAPPVAKKPPPAVKFQLVEEKDVPITISTIGNISSFLSVEIRTQVTGQILEANVEEGAWVKKGDLLFTIDPSLYMSSLNKAKGTLAKDKSLLELSKVKLGRNAELVKKEFISAVVYDELKSNVESQEAQVQVDEADVNTAQINLDRTKIYAFSDGKIGQFNFDPGNIVSPLDSKPLTTLEFLDQVNVNFSLPENKFDKISAQALTESLPFDVFLGQNQKIGSGKVVFINNRIASETGTFLIKGIAENDKKLMWPGQFVKVVLILNTQKNALLVPETAVQSSQKGPLIWLLNDDLSVKSLVVEPGEKDNGWVVIKSGLKKGDKIITLGQSNLKDGVKVYVQPDATKPIAPETKPEKVAS